MASISEMIVGSALESAQKAPDISGSITKGAELAQTIQNMQLKRQELEQKKSEQSTAKWGLIGTMYDRWQKLPPGAAKKNVGEKVIPAMLDSFGLSQDMNPAVKEMLVKDPVIGSFLYAKTRDGAIKLPDMIAATKQPDTFLTFITDNGLAQFGSEELIKSTVEESLPELQEAYAKRVESNETDKRTAINAAATAGQRGVTNANTLRDDLTKNPVTKNTFALEDAFDKIRTNLGGKPSAAGDIAGIFNFMRMNDPASTVREGEFATAQNAAGVPDQLRNIYNKALNGERLSPGQRKQFLSTAASMYRTQFAKQQQVNKDAEKIAKKTGIDPDLVFLGTKFKEPPPEKREFTVSPRQIEIFKAADPDGQKAIINRVKTQFGISEGQARAKLQGGK